jgi:hypothetical protein
MSEKKELKAELKLTEPLKFFAAILHPDGEYECRVFESVKKLVSCVKDLIDKDVSVFTFAGTQLKVSKPPFRHLLTPWGAHPLFDVPTTFEPDDTGYLGSDPILMADPPQISEPKQTAADNDEFFDDGSSQELGVFDNALPDPDS